MRVFLLKLLLIFSIIPRFQNSFNHFLLFGRYSSRAAFVVKITQMGMRHHCFSAHLMTTAHNIDLLVPFIIIIVIRNIFHLIIGIQCRINSPLRPRFQRSGCCLRIIVSDVLDIPALIYGRIFGSVHPARRRHAARCTAPAHYFCFVRAYVYPYVFAFLFSHQSAPSSYDRFLGHFADPTAFAKPFASKRGPLVRR